MRLQVRRVHREGDRQLVSRAVGGVKVVRVADRGGGHLVRVRVQVRVRVRVRARLRVRVRARVRVRVRSKRRPPAVPRCSESA